MPVTIMPVTVMPVTAMPVTAMPVTAMLTPQTSEACAYVVPRQFALIKPG